MRCQGCGCDAPGGAVTHALVAALLADDLDRAIATGLLTCECCPGCSAACKDGLATARESRRAALAARERHRTRVARLLKRAADLAARRAPAQAIETAPTLPATRPALPPAAAAVLARAKARAAERHKPS